MIEHKGLKTSTRMAIGMGLFLPVAETVRRINQILDISAFFSWFDDYILGAILLWAAIRVYRKGEKYTGHLIAAWGISSGALFLSFIGQFSYFQTASGDPGIFTTTVVAIAKGLILGFMLMGLYNAIRANTYLMKNGRSEYNGKI